MTNAEVRTGLWCHPPMPVLNHLQANKLMEAQEIQQVDEIHETMKRQKIKDAVDALGAKWAAVEEQQKADNIMKEKTETIKRKKIQDAVDALGAKWAAVEEQQKADNIMKERTEAVRKGRWLMSAQTMEKKRDSITKFWKRYTEDADEAGETEDAQTKEVRKKKRKTATQDYSLQNAASSSDAVKKF
jgi:hypothetical protein